MEAWNVVGIAWVTRGMVCWACCATWHAMGSKPAPHPSPPSIPTLAPHLAPPCEAIPAPTNHMPWVIGVP